MKQITCSGSNDYSVRLEYLIKKTIHVLKKHINIVEKTAIITISFYSNNNLSDSTSSQLPLKQELNLNYCLLDIKKLICTRFKHSSAWAVYTFFYYIRSGRNIYVRIQFLSFMEAEGRASKPQNHVFILPCHGMVSVMHRVFVLYWLRTELVVACSLDLSDIVFYYFFTITIVFENSLFGIKRYRLWGMYSAGILIAMVVIGVNGWFASAAKCLQYFKIKGLIIASPPTSEVNGEQVHWTCRRASVPFIVSSAIGICGISVMNIIIGYMYITRMIHTARAVHRNEKLDLVHIGANPSDHEISDETMRILMHVKKCCIIALTSIIVSLFSFVVTWASNVDFAIFVDCFFNGILMLSSFTFAEDIFKFCFGCCDKPLQMLLSRFIKDT
ncbi:hypothetical protein RFI_17505 [Reticulomyxa filosa]|uniref:Uncharacterized protein n=1 Tax=Reticulomyxa filosa TaxID=46433 RepID=X6N0C0_RETFI|nr:hypothetical protein RFI_17505 [Reticulomyxa filosa]|eukprot:ETO19725.1 hypothetical protein RFI_17505 [Reticulomyxa filosa]